MTTAPYLNPCFDANDLEGRNTDEHEADLKAAIEATATLVDMDTGEIHTGTALAPAALDGEWISRESRLAVLEQEAYAYRNQARQIGLSLGRVLLEYRGLCRDQDLRFLALIDRLGYSKSSAYRFMAVANTVAQHPALESLAETSTQKIVAMTEGLDDEQVIEIIDGRGAISLDDVDKMSNKQLKKAFRKLRDDKDQIVKEETKTLASELKGVKEDLANARAALDPDLATARKTAREVRATTQALADQVLKLMDQVKPLDKRDAEHLRPALESSIQGGSLLLRDLWQTWQEQVLELGLDD